MEPLNSTWSLSNPEAVSAAGTILAAVIALLIALFIEPLYRRIRFELTKPKLSLHFDPDRDRCKRTAIIIGDVIQDLLFELNTKRTYFRLRVANSGGLANGVICKVDLYSLDGRELERFEPSILRWVEGESEPRIKLSRGEITYINLISVVQRATNSDGHTWPIEDIVGRVRIEIFSGTPRGIAYDRQLQDFLMRVAVHSEEVAPVVVWMIFLSKDQQLELLNKHEIPKLEF